MVNEVGNNMTEGERREMEGERRREMEADKDKERRKQLGQRKRRKEDSVGLHEQILGQRSARQDGVFFVARQSEVNLP